MMSFRNVTVKMSSLGVLGDRKMDFSARVAASRSLRFSRMLSMTDRFGFGASVSSKRLMVPAATMVETLSSLPAYTIG